MSRIRVLIVDDSLTVRKRLAETLRNNPAFEVVGEAADGDEAIALCERLRPDVITLDMMLPTVTGIAVTEHVMANFPTPILIVSASINRGELFRTYDALAAGAVDVLEKPRGTEPEGEWEAAFVSRVKLVSRIKVIRHFRRRVAPTQPQARQPQSNATPIPSQALRVIAVGASTGGPSALLHILRAVPPTGQVPILIVLHLAETFATAFAQWMDSQTGHRVRYARHGEALAALGGAVVMAPATQHLELREGRLVLSDAPARHSCRPSVDVLFESIAREVGPASAAVLLTGMGRDGASGLLAIRNAGGITIAQDEATSVVYGMPREAVLLGAAQRVLPLGELGPTIAALRMGGRA